MNCGIRLHEAVFSGEKASALSPFQEFQGGGKNFILLLVTKFHEEPLQVSKTHISDFRTKTQLWLQFIRNIQAVSALPLALSQVFYFTAKVLNEISSNVRFQFLYLNGVT